LTGGPGVPTLGYVGADAFWNERYRRDGTARLLGPAAWSDRVLADSLAFFGDLAGRTLVDLGCGDGRASVFFARHGARVIAVDSSSVAIENLFHFCTENGVTNMEPVCASAFDVARYGPADLVFGSMVLHHLEPFAEFGLVLRALMKADAKAFFYENNGRNPLLMLLRRHVVGRFGVPKQGDSEESPLTQEEIETLRRHFRVRVDYPELLLMRLASGYLFRGHLKRPLGWLDAMLYRIVPLRKYGYRQYVYLECLRR
jgi:2-polyprenyl-3-methyl-5-hydroxy-6-metoxy-1,4-benzoquinol methylase